MDRVPPTRRLVRRFVAGRQASEALTVLGALTGQGLRSAVTYLGENVRTATDAARATATYLELLDAIGARQLPTTPSVKLTHLGLDLDEALCIANLTRIVERARAVGTSVWVDMESSRYTERTLALVARLRPTHPNLGCVVQAYLRRTPRDVERLVELGATVRLCKGAYREPPTVAYPDKRDVDASYARLAERLLAADAQAAASIRASRPTTSACNVTCSPWPPGAASPAIGSSCRCSTGSATTCTPRSAPPARRCGSWSRSARTGTATSCGAWPNGRPISSSCCVISAGPDRPR
jgi:proline dehydrogenase